MSDIGLLHAQGAQPNRPNRFVPITVQRFFSGLWTQRSPFSSPDNRYTSRYLGGRPDILIDGANVELTNYNTLIRRPGFTLYSSATLPSEALNLFSFHKLDTTITLLADTATGVYIITPTTATLLYTKSDPGQINFLSIGNQLFMSNGVDKVKWNGSQISAPAAPSLSAVVSGALPGATYYVKTTYLNAYGETTASAESSLVVAGNSVVKVTSPIVKSGATTYNVYVSTSAGTETKQNAAPITIGTDWQEPDSGLIAGAALPSSNTAQYITTWGITAPVAAPTLAFSDADDLWAALTNYALNDTIVDSNGNQQKVTTDAGSSAATVPVWNRNTGGTTTDGGLTWTNQGPIGLSPTQVNGYSYVFSYKNSVTGHVSTASPVSANTGVMIGQKVTITGARSTDSQVDQVEIFRTSDGGEFYDSLAVITNPASGSWSFIDNLPDTSLNEFRTAPLSNSNDPPPSGFGKMVYHVGRIWGISDNNVYVSGGPDVLTGSGNESFPPANVFVYPSVGSYLAPSSFGLLVFTTSDIFVIPGTNMVTFYSQLFQAGVGVLSYNAVAEEGSQLYIYTSDRQFLSIGANGINELGYPIGVDLATDFDPTEVTITAHASGSQDKAVYIADGTDSWYRCNWNQPPEGGPAWSPLGTVAAGLTFMASLETSPGVHQLLAAQSNGKILVRDYSVFSDNGVNYSAFATFGSVVLANPGFLAEVESITVELQNVGTLPAISVLVDEISGDFEDLINSVNDPPQLVTSTTIMSKRFYLSQSNLPAWLRHMQLKITFATEAERNELLTYSIYGAIRKEQ